MGGGDVEEAVGDEVEAARGVGDGGHVAEGDPHGAGGAAVDEVSVVTAHVTGLPFPRNGLLLFISGRYAPHHHHHHN